MKPKDRGVPIEHRIHARQVDVTSEARRQSDVEEAGRRLGPVRSAPASFVEGGFTADTVVMERRVANAAGISRTPMGAAMARLEGEGPATRSGNGRFVIRRSSLDGVLQNLRVRRLLETETVRDAFDAAVARQAMKVHFDKVGQRLVARVDPSPP